MNLNNINALSYNPPRGYVILKRAEIRTKDSGNGTQNLFRIQWRGTSKYIPAGPRKNIKSTNK